MLGKGEGEGGLADICGENFSPKCRIPCVHEIARVSHEHHIGPEGGEKCTLDKDGPKVNDRTRAGASERATMQRVELTYPMMMITIRGRSFPVSGGHTMSDRRGMGKQGNKRASRAECGLSVALQGFGADIPSSGCIFLTTYSFAYIRIATHRVDTTSMSMKAPSASGLSFGGSSKSAVCPSGGAMAGPE